MHPRQRGAANSQQHRCWVAQMLDGTVAEPRQSGATRGAQTQLLPILLQAPARCSRWTGSMRPHRWRLPWSSSRPAPPGPGCAHWGGGLLGSRGVGGLHMGGRNEPKSQAGRERLKQTQGRKAFAERCSPVAASTMSVSISKVSSSKDCRPVGARRGRMQPYCFLLFSHPCRARVRSQSSGFSHPSQVCAACGRDAAGPALGPTWAPLRRAPVNRRRPAARCRVATQHGTWQIQSEGQQASGKQRQHLHGAAPLGTRKTNSPSRTVGQLLQLFRGGQAVQVQAILGILLRGKLADLARRYRAG